MGLLRSNGHSLCWMATATAMASTPAYGREVYVSNEYLPKRGMYITGVLALENRALGRMLGGCMMVSLGEYVFL